MHACWYILLLVAPLLRAQPDEAEHSFQRALELHQKGDFEGAIQQYLVCLKANPRKIEARSNLGAVLVRVGRYGEAIEQYRMALDGAPPQMTNPLRMNLALAYYKTGEIPQAARELVAVQAADPGNLQVTLLLADCHLRMGEFSKVVELLKPLEGGDSKDSLAIRYMLGTALIRNGQVREGQTAIDPILRNSDSAEAKLLVGMGMFIAGDYPAAVGQFRRVIEINPSLPSVYSYYGQALLYTGDADGAQAAFRKALTEDPNDFEANLRLGQILEARQRYPDALPLIERALRSRPGSLEVHEDLATVYGKLGRGEDASREAAIVKQAGPRQAPAQAVQGPSVGQPAPDFKLAPVGSGAPIELRGLRKVKPVLIVFGSYTCPKLRASAPALEELHGRYGQKIGFVFIYIREAHAGADWQSTINQREGVQLAEARTPEEKQEHAALCIRKVKFSFPAAIDGLDNRVEALYGAWPSRAFLVGTDGKVLWSSPLGELDFKPGELEAAIRGTGSRPSHPFF